MSQPFRLATGGRIERGAPLSFRLDGAAYTGYRGDTLASALLANGVHLVGRSFKYHRPRGIMSAPANYKPHQTWDQQFGRTEAHNGGAASPAGNALPVVIPNGEARPLPAATGGHR